MFGGDGVAGGGPRDGASSGAALSEETLTAPLLSTRVSINSQSERPLRPVVEQAPLSLRASDIGIGENKVEARMRFSVFNLCNTIMGGGVLSMAYAFRVRAARFLVCSQQNVSFRGYCWGRFCCSLSASCPSTRSTC